MARIDQSSSTGRSAAGFALAITLAVLTFWAGGVVVELHSYGTQPAAQGTASNADGARHACPNGADDEMQCVVPQSVKAGQ